MSSRLPATLFLGAALSFAQGTTPKPAPSDYDVHLSAGTLDLGAEYMVHSFSNGEQMFLAERFLVVEFAIYPVMKTDEVTVDFAKFGLRLNHKTLLPAIAAAQVANSLKQQPWSMQGQPGMNGGIGAGPIDVPIGQGPRQDTGQYPGQGTGQYPGNGPYPQDRRRPNPPRAPEPDPPGGIQRTRVSAEEVLLQTALPPGPHKGPVSGFVYFYFTGKPSSLKSVELDYGGVTLKLK